MDIKKQIELCQQCETPPTYYFFENSNKKKLYRIKCLKCKISASSSSHEETISNWNNCYGQIELKKIMLARCRKCRKRPDLSMIILNKELVYNVTGCDCNKNNNLIFKSRALIIDKWNSLYGA
jgi:hypothetical protein